MFSLRSQDSPGNKTVNGSVEEDFTCSPNQCIGLPIRLVEA